MRVARQHDSFSFPETFYRTHAPAQVDPNKVKILDNTADIEAKMRALRQAQSQLYQGAQQHTMAPDAWSHRPGATSQAARHAASLTAMLHLPEHVPSVRRSEQYFLRGVDKSATDLSNINVKHFSLALYWLDQRLKTTEASSLHVYELYPVHQLRTKLATLKPSLQLLPHNVTTLKHSFVVEVLGLLASYCMVDATAKDGSPAQRIHLAFDLALDCFNLAKVHEGLFNKQEKAAFLLMNHPKYLSYQQQRQAVARDFQALVVFFKDNKPVFQQFPLIKMAYEDFLKKLQIFLQNNLPNFFVNFA